MIRWNVYKPLGFDTVEADGFQIDETGALVLYVWKPVPGQVSKEAYPVSAFGAGYWLSCKQEDEG